MIEGKDEEYITKKAEELAELILKKSWDKSGCIRWIK